MNPRILSSVAIAASAVLLITGCGATDAPTPQTSTPPSSEGYHIDPTAEQISEEAAQRITELYEAALAAGENELSIISGLPDDMLSTWAAFEEMFPGITVTHASLIGAPLITQLQAEMQSGNHVTDVLHNPNGQQYVDFAQEYEVVGMTVPASLESSRDQLVDPNHKFTSPYLAFFGLGVFLPREAQSGLEPPTRWADLAEPEYAGHLGTGDPNLPGAPQDAPIYLLQNGGLTEDEVETLASQVVIKGTYGDAIAALMQGEFTYMFSAPSSPVINSAKAGAPVEFRLMDDANYVVTHKQLLLENAPHPHVGKLYLEFLNTLTAQKELAANAMAPLNPAAADPTQPWTSWEAGGLTEIVPWTQIAEVRPALVEWFSTIFTAN